MDSAAQSPAQGEAALPSNPVTPARGLTAAAPCASPALEAAYDRSITRAQKMQMESLQRQLKVTAECNRPKVPHLAAWAPAWIHPSHDLFCQSMFHAVQIWHRS